MSDKFVDARLPVTKVTTLDIVLEFARPPATSRVRELEGPQEVRCLEKRQSAVSTSPSSHSHLLKVGTSSSNFVHQVLHTKDIKFAKGLLDDSVVGKWNALFVDLAISTLVDQLADRLEIGFTWRHHSTGELDDVELLTYPYAT